MAWSIEAQPQRVKITATSLERTSWRDHWLPPDATDEPGPFEGYAPTKARALKAYRAGSPVRSAVSTAASKVMKRTEKAAEDAAGRVAQGVGRAVLKPENIGAAAAIGATVLAAAGTFALAYFVASVNQLGYIRGRDAKVEAVNRAYRQARQKAVERLGLSSPRDIPRDVLKALDTEWRVALARAEANEPINSRAMIAGGA